jgi:hypothetical protein
MRCKHPVLVRGSNPAVLRRVLVGVVGALTVLAALTAAGCGGSSGNGTPSASPSPPSSTAAPETTTAGGTPAATAANDISADQLRQDMAAAAAKVNDANWESYLVGSESNVVLHSKNRSGGVFYSFFSQGKGTYSPPLNVGDRVDYLTVDHIRYWRVNDGPWKNDPNEPPDPSTEPDLFPNWYALVSVPVGVPVSMTQSGPADSWKSPPGGSVTYTLTATGISASGSASSTGRCWDLTINYELSETGQPPPNATAWPVTQEYVLTACQPDLLVTKFVTKLYDGRQLVEDKYQYNTGVPLGKPDQVTEVSCPPYTSVSQDRINCWFGSAGG